MFRRNSCHEIVNFIDNKNCIDHFEYLRFRKVKILLEFKEYSQQGQIVNYIERC